MEVLRLLVAGAVAIGMVTALTIPGRQTVAAISASGNAASGLLGTAIRG